LDRVLRFVIACSILAIVGCETPTDPSSGDPKEEHILSETQRFAGILNIRVRAVVTNEIYMVMASDGSGKVPAAGWYNDGVIKYYRPVVIERSMEYGSQLAAHETCHVLFSSEKAADDCARTLSV
jgi:hypothetical protein